jgi:predicted RNA-binding Zn-ribbon protein involved in translation (DUF1610 family)
LINYLIKEKEIKMAEYRKKPVVIEAVRWFQNGDHPLDEYEKGTSNEGKLVRRYRTPDVNGQKECQHCGHIMHDHGWIETLESGHVVCPGDWIITGVKGEHYPCKNDIFWQTYEVDNQEVIEIHNNWPRLTNIPCPYCGEDLIYSCQCALLTSPAKRATHCKNCDYMGYVLM